MTIVIAALSIALLISLAVNVQLNSIKNQYRNKVLRNNGKNLVLATKLWKEIEAYKHANFKNQKLIEELITTNHEQAQKIHDLKNRISF